MAGGERFPEVGEPLPWGFISCRWISDVSFITSKPCVVRKVCDRCDHGPGPFEAAYIQAQPASRWHQEPPALVQGPCHLEAGPSSGLYRSSPWPAAAGLGCADSSCLGQLIPIPELLWEGRECTQGAVAAPSILQQLLELGACLRRVPAPALNTESASCASRSAWVT